MRKAFWILSTLLIPAAFAAETLMYVGTYTQGTSKGVYAFRFNTDTGQMTPLGLAAQYRNASFLTISPDRKFLYAVSEVDNYNGAKSGGVAAFSINSSTGMLTKLNEKATQGGGACQVSLDRASKNIGVANFNGGNVAVFPVKPDGSLGDVSSTMQHTGKPTGGKQDAPRTHSVVFSPENQYALVPDFGLDELRIYKFTAASGTLGPNPTIMKFPAGSAPRHFSFHPTGAYGYLLNEISSSVSAFRWDAKTGKLSEQQAISTLPKGNKTENFSAEILTHPTGKFLYASNRGHDSIAVFSIDAKSGKLTYVETASTQGKYPRNFGIDPSGKFLVAANQESGSLISFRIDPNSGKLTRVGDLTSMSAPVCVRFLPLP